MIIDPNRLPTREELNPPPTPGPRHRLQRALGTAAVVIGAFVVAVALAVALNSLIS